MLKYKVADIQAVRQLPKYKLQLPDLVIYPPVAEIRGVYGNLADLCSPKKMLANFPHTCLET